MNNIDQLPNIFQANADRFYQRVISVTLGQLPTHDTLTVGQASTVDEFLDRSAAMVDNYTANEAAKAFTLTLDGIFQRQLSRWANAQGVKSQDWKELLKKCAELANLNLETNGIASDINEMHLVANVVRHGEGKACVELKKIVPKLWENSSRDYYDLAPGPALASEELRIRPNDLKRYARAVVRFWGHVSKNPPAVIDPPY